MYMTPTDKQLTFTEDQVALLRSTICPEATDDELALFIQRCKSTGLDPFANQIYLVKRSKTSPATMQTGIDGFRLVAQRTGERDGQDAPEWCGEDGVFKPIWTGKGPPLACRMVVYRKGHTKGYPSTAYWEFYAQKKSNGELNNIWTKGAAHMLCKCAEALALRMAFPNELSGLYTSDEMAQADVQHNNLLSAPTISLEDAKMATQFIKKMHPLESQAELEKLLPEIVAMPRAAQIMVKPTYGEKQRQFAEKQASA
jgi:phage recombination protein Bet